MVFKQHLARASVIIVALLLGAVHGVALAQGIGVKIHPTAIDERLDPGGSATGEITVTNEEGGVQTYYIGTQNIETMDEYGKPIYSDIQRDDPYAAASWISPDVD